MLLYKQDNNTLRVFDFSSNDCDLRDYRIKKMSEIEETERVLCAETYISAWSDTPIFEYFSRQYYDKILTKEYADFMSESERRYHILKRNPHDKIHNKKLLDFYYSGNLKDRNMVRVKYLEGLKYFLLKNRSYTFLGENFGRKYRMDDIIQLPKSLYLLQLLEQGNYKALFEFDISEQLELFNIDEVDEIDLYQLLKTDKLGITNNVCDDIINKAKNDEYILRLIKK